MSTNFNYITHVTPRVPTVSGAVKRVFKDRPVYSYAVGNWTSDADRLIAERRVRESRHLAAFLGDCGQLRCEVCEPRRD